MAWLRTGLCLTLVISIAASLKEIESTASSAPCQLECSINFSISVIDCRSCLCDVIPNAPPNQTWVKVLLSNNSIEFVSPLAAVYPTVQYLDLGHNKISSMADDAFEGLASLTNLILCHNNLTSFNFNLLRSLTSLNELSLESSGLTALQGFEESFSSNVKTLDLSSNKIATLGAGLQGFKQLLMLNLSHNLIKRIDMTDFGGVTMDRESELYLTDNDIDSIADNAFSQCCAGLRLLDLTYNYIHTLTPDTFRGLKLLAHLDLSENRLRTVDTSAFNCLESLWTLVIELNYLESFTANDSALAMPTTLREVVLLHTKLTVIENGTFANMRYLNNVTIAGNDKLTRIGAGVFSGDTKSSVRFLNISYNALTLLEADTLDWDSVLSVDASGNNWVCNCSMMWIKNSSFLNRAGSTFKCSEPSHLKGKNPALIDVSQFECKWVNTTRGRRTGVWLLVIVTLTFVVLLTYFIYKNRRRLLPRAFGQPDKYATLYNAADMDDSTITLHRADELDQRSSRIVRDPRQTPVDV